MKSNREIERFLANLEDDEYAGFNVLERLLRRYDWLGAVITPADINGIFENYAGRPITENEYELVKYELDGFLEDELVQVAIQKVRDVCYEVLKGIQ